MRSRLSLLVGCALLVGLGCRGTVSLDGSVHAGGAGNPGGLEASGGMPADGSGSGGSGETPGAGATNPSTGEGGADTGSLGGDGSTVADARRRGFGGKGGGGGRGGSGGAAGKSGSGGRAGSGGAGGSGASGGAGGSGGSGASAGSAGRVGSGGSGGSSSAGAPSTGGGPSTGAHVLVEQSITVGKSKITSAGINTQTSGSSLVVAAGRGSGSLLVPSTISDNMGNSPFVQQGAKLNYAGYPDSSAALFTFLHAKGGTGHTFSLSDLSSDEGTLVAVEVKNGLVVHDVKGANVAAGSTLASPSVTTTGPATIVAFCWPGGGYGFSSIGVNNSFTVLDKYGAQDGLSVQAASATRDVSAAGTYGLTWTISPAQDAIVFIIALQ